MDKFLLATNPLREKSEQVFVIHTLFPKMMIRCVKGHVEPKEGEDYYFMHFSFADENYQTQYYTLSIYYREPGICSIPWRELLKKCWRWYRAYLEQQIKAEHEKY